MPYLLLIKIGIAIALAVAAAWAWHLFTRHYIDIGAARVRSAWDADKAERIKLTTGITNLWNDQRQKTETAQNERDQARQQIADAIKQRVASLPPAVAAQHVDPAFVGVLRAGRDQANLAGTAAESHEAASPGTAGADASNLGLIAGWITEVTDILAECRDRVSAWQTFYSGLRAAQQESP